MARILEESENIGDRMATVKTSRGEEKLFNVDQTVCAVAELFSNLDNEEANGWTLSVEYYRSELSRLRAASILQTIRTEKGDRGNEY